MIPLLVAYLCPLLLIGSPVLGPTSTSYFDSVNNAAVRSSAMAFATVLGLTAVVPGGFAAGPRYVPQWKKQACEIPAAHHRNSHYVCDEAGEVKCIPGWTGDLCDVPLCKKGCDPLQGYCHRPGECLCKFGFYGKLCNECVALPGCQHGSCNVSFECACDRGWKGLFCSEPICDADCHPSQGYCDKPGGCKCRFGWQGPKCKQCSVLPGCVHGTCQAPLECRCEPGWTGVLCQTPICAKGCSRKYGGCRRPGTCWCGVGWTGPNCTECVPYPGCAHGFCRKPWECRCEPGWAGDLCEEKLTFCDHHENICQNNGSCISLSKEDGDYRCVCPLGFTGRQCQIETTIPATDLTPPMQEIPIEIATAIADSTTDGIETANPSTTRTPSIVVGHGINEFLGTTKKINHKDVTTVEPLETIYITDSSTVDSAATAGKWPTEPPTDSPITDNDADNEA